jgi:hypothetical protein
VALAAPLASMSGATLVTVTALVVLQVPSSSVA